ncbi:ABC transporter permease subunit [Gordonia terrae]|uniref:ABC transporter permease n=1 Tax=Gordonia hongkongensis TaxID=1701090 RepID=UPI0022B3D471|nr:ABC transporter permease subunit [Gordonia terrae]
MTTLPATQSFGRRIRTEFKPRRVLLGAVVLIIGWEVAALLFTRGMTHPEYVMPDLWYVANHGIPGLSDYYRGAFGGQLTSEGATPSFFLGVLAIVEHSLVSVMRVVTGFAAGTAAGILLGLVMSAIRPVRLAGFGVSNMLRMLPLLALAPLFTLWFGPITLASIVSIAFVVCLITIIGTMAAVGNLEPSTVEYARTLGAGRAHIYRRIVLPSIIPELCATTTLCVPMAWSVLLASELYGIQNGVGWMMGQSLSFTLVDRITVIAAVFIVLTFASLRLVQILNHRLTK